MGGENILDNICKMRHASETEPPESIPCDDLSLELQII